MNHLKELEYGKMSEFCRDAILEKINNLNSDEYLRNLKKQKLAEIKKIDEQLKNNGNKKIQANSQLQNYYTIYLNNNRSNLPEHMNLYWIKEKILPALRKNGCTGLNPQKINDLFKKNFENNNEVLDESI